MLRIPRLLFNQMCDHAQHNREYEVCGVLVGVPGTQTVVQIVAGQNVAPEPAHHFTLDAATLLRADAEARAQGREIVGFYHSHPNQSPFPSVTDRAMIWADVPTVIIAISNDSLAVCGWQQHGSTLQPCLLQIEPVTDKVK